MEFFGDMTWWTAINWSGRILGISFIPSVLLKRTKHPLAALAWILALLFIPFIGALLWWMIGRDRMNRRPRAHTRAKQAMAPRFARLEKHSAPKRLPEQTLLNNASPEELLSSEDRLIFRDQYGVFPSTYPNWASIYPTTEKAFDAFEQAIDAAKHHVHFLFYALADDTTGRRFRDLLIKKAHQGLEVRVLYDAVGSVGLGRSFLAPFHEAGVQVHAFLPLHIWERRLRINFRNHRKLLIIDGICGFTGGVNISDSYLDWYDMAFGFEGPVVHQMQEVFAEDWYFTCKEDLADAPYFPGLEEGLNRQRRPSRSALLAPQLLQAPGDKLHFPVASRVVDGGPDEPLLTTHKMFFLALTSARERLYIITAYFVPDGAILTALQTAAMRGVDVRIILPGKSDHNMTRHASRSCWEALLEAGVRLFELQGPILHAKLLLMDSTHVIVGSANMDIRSFRFSFEASTVVRGHPFNRSMTRIFLEAQENSVEISLPQFRNRPRKERLLEGMARLISPLL